jgi:hypothetical protein
LLSFLIDIFVVINLISINNFGKRKKQRQNIFEDKKSDENLVKYGYHAGENLEIHEFFTVLA